MPLFARYFSLPKGFYALLCTAYYCKMPAVLVHFALRFGAFCLAFWCISLCVLVHFALRFGAFYPAFWCFLPQIMLQKALDGVQNVYLNNLQWLFIHLCAHLVLPQVSWRNTRKNVGERRNGQKNRSHNVKFRAQNITSPLSVFSSTQHNFAVSKPCPCRPLKSKIRHREF